MSDQYIQLNRVTGVLKEIQYNPSRGLWVFHKDGSPVYVKYQTVVWYVNAQEDPLFNIIPEQFKNIEVKPEVSLGPGVDGRGSGESLAMKAMLEELQFKHQLEMEKVRSDIYTSAKIAKENLRKDALQGMKQLIKRIHDNPPSRFHAAYAEYLSYRRTLDMPHITLEQFTEDINEMLRMKYYKDPEPYWTENDLVPGDQFS